MLGSDTATPKMDVLGYSAPTRYIAAVAYSLGIGTDGECGSDGIWKGPNEMCCTSDDDGDADDFESSGLGAVGGWKNGWRHGWALPDSDPNKTKNTR